MLKNLLCAFFICMYYCVDNGDACNGCEVDQSSFKAYPCSPTTEDLFYWPEKEPMSVNENCVVKIPGNRRFNIDINSFKLSVQGKHVDYNFEYHTDDGCAALENNQNGNMSFFMSYLRINSNGVKCPVKANDEFNAHEQAMSKEHQAQLIHYAGFNNVTVSFNAINGDESKSICYVIESQLNCKKHHHIKAPKS